MSRHRVSPYPMISVPSALELVLKETEVKGCVEVPLHESIGLVLAKDVLADMPLPPFPASVVDGYAVIAEDGVGEYPVMGVVTAGKMNDFIVTKGKIAQITTGSAVPQGSDAIVMIEDTDLVETKDGVEIIRIKKASRKGQFIRSVGSDIMPNNVVVTKGESIGAAEVGLIATVGTTNVTVYRPPVVGILSTGDELVEPNEKPNPGQIRDSNRSMLLAALSALGNIAKGVDLGIAKDTREELEGQVLEALNKVDILVTSGGVSMGELDLLKPILESIGKVHFGRICMKPGKPCTFATVEVKGEKKYVFGLPGNPVSSIVCFYLFVVPAIKNLSGHANPNLPKLKAKLKNKIKLDPERPEYHRATLSWDDKEQFYVAESTGIQASSRLLSMKSANSLLVLPNENNTLEVGSIVNVLLIGSLT